MRFTYFQTFLNPLIDQESLNKLVNPNNMMKRRFYVVLVLLSFSLPVLSQTDVKEPPKEMEYVNKSANQLIVEIRLNEANRMLQQRAGSVSEV